MKICSRYSLNSLGRSFLEQFAGSPMESLKTPENVSPDDTRQDEVSVLAKIEDFTLQIAGVRVRTALDLEIAILTSKKYLVEYIAVLGKNRSRQYRKLGRLTEQWQSVLERAERMSTDVAPSVSAKNVSCYWTSSTVKPS